MNAGPMYLSSERLRALLPDAGAACPGALCAPPGPDPYRVVRERNAFIFPFILEGDVLGIVPAITSDDGGSRVRSGAARWRAGRSGLQAFQESSLIGTGSEATTRAMPQDVEP